jgi:hypothetical protein
MENNHGFSVGQKVYWTGRISPFFPTSGSGSVESIVPSKIFLGHFTINVRLDKTDWVDGIPNSSPEFKYLRPA